MKLKNIGLAGLLLMSVEAMAAPALTQAELDAYAEANANISPVTTIMDVNKNARNCGFRGDGLVEYTVTWRVTSYHNELRTAMSIHDCKDKAPGTCGLTYEDRRIVGTPWLDAPGIPDPTWTYKATNGTTVKSISHDFSATFTMPATHHEEAFPWSSESPNGGDQVVFRWWHYSPEDENPVGVSLLLGTEAGNHYGTNIRRIQSTVSSDLDPTSEECATSTPQ